jgi:hypothetical protein
MPRKQAYCARGPDHEPPCATAQAMENHRVRRRARVRNDPPEARARWARAYKFVRFGITEEQFDQLLEAQGYACGICREPFKEGQRICIDHDHSCCPVPPSGLTRSCGQCIRGLLCVRCNTWLGWLEKYGELVNAYLAAAEGRQRGVPRPSRDMGSTDRNPSANAGDLSAR